MQEAGDPDAGTALGYARDNFHRETAPPLNTPAATRRALHLEPHDPRRLSLLCGQFHEHLKLIERRLGVRIDQRAHDLQIVGGAQAVDTAVQVLQRLYAETEDQHELAPETVHLVLQIASGQDAAGTQTGTGADGDNGPVLITRKGAIRPRGHNQRRYVEQILSHDISFGVGPAGTGKTYLAVACAVDQLEKDLIRRILLVRPAVEAGEKLGFLPGDLSEKINPYLRPLYDALYEMLGFDRVAKLIERQVIEVAPLAYMRGRTLNHAFIILDEGQNTTPEQMKMFLTRLGYGSKAVITGDITQVDLPRGTQSGLSQALKILDQVEGIHITRFATRDVVRHPLVMRIVDAYEAFDAAREQQAQQDRRERRDTTAGNATGDAP
ncbi:PhoH family protein [Amnimonas aquatica]|uniref:PhoH-like protein n=1 Tax=Amnimonas aquatica TaxID=2094561 RepID=A0A2P6AT19_9GAMM|nr:PhoH family protein [Amnimonas aquatica]